MLCAGKGLKPPFKTVIPPPKPVRPKFNIGTYGYFVFLYRGVPVPVSNTIWRGKVGTPEKCACIVIVIVSSVPVSNIYCTIIIRTRARPISERGRTRTEQRSLWNTGYRLSGVQNFRSCRRGKINSRLYSYGSHHHFAPMLCISMMQLDHKACNAETKATCKPQNRLDDQCIASCLTQISYLGTALRKVFCKR